MFISLKFSNSRDEKYRENACLEFAVEWMKIFKKSNCNLLEIELSSYSVMRKCILIQDSSQNTNFFSDKEKKTCAFLSHP
jgi:hypothetical protein